MPSVKASSLAELPPNVSSILERARRATFSTLLDDGSIHSVPVVFVIENGKIVSPIDDKPKSSKDLQRVRNLEVDPRATFLADLWDEEWTRIGWVMVKGTVSVEPISTAGVALRERYSQYDEEMTTGERALYLTPSRISWWTWST
ncbi:MAG TPA: pyridoxamine 5'-phosphate oxidase family protein [Actinomycetota bacterium]|nr:pyridoxamine 5'-phosphate oxidase family protein [Actinomycetota bacterium]